MSNYNNEKLIELTQQRDELIAALKLIADAELVNQIAELTKQIKELRDELLGLSSVLITGAQAINEFNKLHQRITQ